jgi:hypothetical protein
MKLCRLRGEVHIVTVKSAGSLLKRGMWHKVSTKHLPTYLEEICFHFNNRKNQFIFRDTLIKSVLSTRPEYKHLNVKIRDAA